MPHDWRRTIPAADWELFNHAGFGAPQQLGTRPAVLVIDVTRGFVGEPGLTVREATRTYRNACGPAAWAALPAIAEVLAAARDRRLPIFYTRGRSAAARRQLGRWATKNARAVEDLERGEEVHQIVPEVAPLPADVVIEKDKPSAFFGTSLTAQLIDAGVDSLIVTGCTTSGCVRATVVDAFSLNYRIAVVEDGVFDRGQLSHDVSLFDMHAKYAQVLPAADVVRQLSAPAPPPQEAPRHSITPQR